MNVMQMTEGKAWIKVGILQAQLLPMFCVPKEIQEQMRAPTFQRQLYTAVTRPRCWGWQISVRRSGEESCASELPKPMKNLAPSNIGRL